VGSVCFLSAMAFCILLRWGCGNGGVGNRDFYGG
jgi:hypothetical protein